MSYETERADIEGRFSTNWGSTTPIAWQNIDYKPPSNDTSWVRFSVLNGGAIQASIAGNSKSQVRSYGVIAINIFTPLNQGTKAGRQLADTAAAIFRNASFGTGIICRQPRIEQVGQSGSFYQIAVFVDYQRDNYH